MALEALKASARVVAGTIGKGGFVRAVRVEWNGVPVEVKAAIEPYLNATAFALPMWVAELNVFWYEEGTDDSAILSVLVREEYRLFGLNIFPAFLSYDPPERYRRVLHELSHVMLKPMDAVADTMLENLPEDNRQIVEEWLRRAKESVTQDITEAFLRVKPYAETAS